MADYTVTIGGDLTELERDLNSIEKRKTKIKVGVDVNESDVTKAIDSINRSLAKGTKGVEAPSTLSKNVRGYFSEYNKAIQSGFKSAEKAVSAGEKTLLRDTLNSQSVEYFSNAKQTIRNARKNLSADEFKDFAVASRQALKTAKTELDRKQVLITAKQLDKDERDVTKQIAKERERIAKQEAKQQEQNAKQLAQAKSAEDKRIAREEKAIAENALRNQTLYRNAARGYMGSSEDTRSNLNARGDSYNDTIDRYLNNNNISQSQRDAFQRRVDSANEAAETKDAIKEEGVAYKEASNQAKLYKQELNGLYSSYRNIMKKSINANVGSKEQLFLKEEALDRLREYQNRREEVESSLSSEQLAQLDYMEQKTDLNLRDTYATRRAAIDAKVTNLQYKSILDSQRRINSLELDRSKISEKETDLYGKYTDAIDKAKIEQSNMIANYGQLGADQQAQLDKLKQEGVYRKENYDLAHQVGELDKDISQNQFTARLNANSKMKGAYKGEIAEIRNLYANAKNDTDMQYASKREQALFAQASAQGKTGLNFIDKFKNGISSFTTMLLGPMALFRYGMNAAKAVMSNVTQMDAAMTELYKVTDNSQHEYDKFRTATEKTSAEIGATQVSLVQSTATFARLGYNLSDSAELGKNAALFANVGDEGMTSTEAAEDMVAIMKGFNIQAEDSIHIVDALNQVGNRFSISSTGLGESLKRSGGAMATANNTLEETIGLTVAANDAMQDPASTGTALRTIALRLRGRHTCLHI